MVKYSEPGRFFSSHRPHATAQEALTDQSLKAHLAFATGFCLY